MRELLSRPLGVALRQVEATGTGCTVPREDLETLKVLGFVDTRPDGHAVVTRLGRDILAAEAAGT